MVDGCAWGFFFYHNRKCWSSEYQILFVTPTFILEPRKKDIGGKWHVIIVDYKTGHKVPSELEQRLQLEIYALGYKQLKGENADSMEIVDIEGNNVISSRAVVEENLVKTTEMIEDACDAVLEGKIGNKSCDKEKCKNCSRKQMCYEE